VPHAFEITSRLVDVTSDLAAKEADSALLHAAIMSVASPTLPPEPAP
jgi:hypothetical protein